MSSREELLASEVQAASVLVMEDEYYVAKSIEMVLGEEGYQVDIAMTGQSALEQLLDRDFDLLVADLRLPDISGMEIIRRVYSNWPRTAVVIITGYPSGDLSTELKKMGFRDYLRKPFTDDELMSAVASALKDKGKAPLAGIRREAEAE